jgi:hypothetical protein
MIAVSSSFGVPGRRSPISRPSAAVRTSITLCTNCSCGLLLFSCLIVVVALVLDELKMVNFVIESWTYLAIDLVIVFGRSFARWTTFGLRGLAWDDFLMVVAVVGLPF